MLAPPRGAANTELFRKLEQLRHLTAQQKSVAIDEGVQVTLNKLD
jgi:hypothetical protein